MMEQYLDVTREQLAEQGVAFSGLLDAAQLALSAQRGDDFLTRPGTHSFDY